MFLIQFLTALTVFLRPKEPCNKALGIEVDTSLEPNALQAYEQKARPRFFLMGERNNHHSYFFK